MLTERTRKLIPETWWGIPKRATIPLF